MGRLPVSWRLPSSAAPTITQAFSPFTHFTAGTGDDTRDLEFRTAGFGNTDLDETLAMAFTTGWALHELPCRHARAPTPRPSRPPPTSPAGCWTTGRSPPASAITAADPWTPVTSPSASPTATRPTWYGPRSPEPATRARRAWRWTPRTGCRAASSRPSSSYTAVRPPRCHCLPPGGRAAVRTRLAPPTGMHRRCPRGHRRPSGQPPLNRPGAPVRAGQIPRWLGSQPGHAGQARPAPRRRMTPESPPATTSPVHQEWSVIRPPPRRM